MKANELAEMVRLRVHLAPGIDLGPGKADLLEGIRDTGSISAAGRRMRMSYKRAWQLVLLALLANSARMHAACCEAIAGDLRFLHGHRSSAAD